MQFTCLSIVFYNANVKQIAIGEPDAQAKQLYAKKDCISARLSTQ